MIGRTTRVLSADGAVLFVVDVTAEAGAIANSLDPSGLHDLPTPHLRRWSVVPHEGGGNLRQTGSAPEGWASDAR